LLLFIIVLLIRSFYQITQATNANEAGGRSKHGLVSLGGSCKGA